jgi:hypothetical protein
MYVVPVSVCLQRACKVEFVHKITCGVLRRCGGGWEVGVPWSGGLSMGDKESRLVVVSCGEAVYAGA